MKPLPRLLPAAAGLLLLVLAATVAEAKPVAVTILKTDSSRLVGFIGNTNDKGIQFLYTENDRAGLGVPHGEVKAVSFTDEGDIMGPARHAYGRANYEEAQQLFKAVADEYEFLWGITRDKLGNFASEARFFQIDCLRRLGRFAEMGVAMETKTGSTLEATIAEVYLPGIELFKLWGDFAGEKWEALAAGLKGYETSLEGKAAELLASPGFAPGDPTDLVQLAFMRGKYYEAQGNKEEALRDLYLAMTLNYGSDRNLTKLAMESALRIQAAEEGLKENRPMQEEIHALAVMYSKGYNNGQAETWYTEYLKPLPELEAKPEAAPAADPADAPEPAAAEPAADADAPAPKPEPADAPAPAPAPDADADADAPAPKP